MFLLVWIVLFRVNQLQAVASSSNLVAHLGASDSFLRTFCTIIPYKNNRPISNTRIFKNPICSQSHCRSNSWFFAIILIWFDGQLKNHWISVTIFTNLTLIWDIRASYRLQSGVRSLYPSLTSASDIAFEFSTRYGEKWNQAQTIISLNFALFITFCDEIKWNWFSCVEIFFWSYKWP